MKYVSIYLTSILEYIHFVHKHIKHETFEEAFQIKKNIQKHTKHYNNKTSVKSNVAFHYKHANRYT